MFPTESVIVFAVVCVLLDPCSATGCPGAYTEYLSTKRCFKYVTAAATRSAALSTCNGDENGWLATLETKELSDGVVAAYSVTEDTYFGLYKLDPSCNSVASCTGKMAWESPAITTGYFANMDG